MKVFLDVVHVKQGTVNLYGSGRIVSEVFLATDGTLSFRKIRAESI